MDNQENTAGEFIETGAETQSVDGVDIPIEMIPGSVNLNIRVEARGEMRVIRKDGTVRYE